VSTPGSKKIGKTGKQIAFYLSLDLLPHLIFKNRVNDFYFTFKEKGIPLQFTRQIKNDKSSQTDWLSIDR
jgi:hypothetical protein